MEELLKGASFEAYNQRVIYLLRQQFPPCNNEASFTYTVNDRTMKALIDCVNKQDHPRSQILPR